MSDKPVPRWEFLEGKRGANRQPFLCLLLYSNGPGFNQSVARYLGTHFREVHGMSGDSCLVVTMGDVRGILDSRSKRPSHGLHALTSAAALGLKPQDPYNVVHQLGIDPASLPCLVVTEEGAEDLVVVSLSTMVENADEASLHRAFVEIFSCTAEAAEKKRGKRLSALRKCVNSKASAESRSFPGGGLVSEVVRGLANAAADQAKGL